MDLPRAGHVIGQKYRLDRQLGRGGMGEVWAARHLQLDADVAVKLLAREHAATPLGRARFEREAKAAAQVKSPHIVHVFDYGVDGEMPYLAMELLEGEDLEARLRAAGRLAIPETAALVAPICKALRRIHDAGLVHRDLKPSNVFLARHDDEVHVKVLDFGIAKVPRGADATTSGVLVGSPPYMSPEHVLAKKQLDHRTDLWSLGVILFRALTGRLPFCADVQTQLLVEICIAPLPRASSIAPSLGPEADAFFDRALARKPDERFQTAAEMAEAFAGFARIRERALPVSPRAPAPFGVEREARAGGDDPTVPLSGATAPVVQDASERAESNERAGEGRTLGGETKTVAPEVPESVAGLRRDRSMAGAMAIGAAAAGLLVWALTALSGSPSPASSGQPARPEMTGRPEVASASSSGTSAPAPSDASAAPPAARPGATSSDPRRAPASGRSPAEDATSPTDTPPDPSLSPRATGAAPMMEPPPSPPPASTPAPGTTSAKREFW